jgi:hypothetical protein
MESIKPASAASGQTIQTYAGQITEHLTVSVSSKSTAAQGTIQRAEGKKPRVLPAQTPWCPDWDKSTGSARTSGSHAVLSQRPQRRDEHQQRNPDIPKNQGRGNTTNGW